eukprot:3304713-Prymnesium_polylepis.1
MLPGKRVSTNGPASYMYHGRLYIRDMCPDSISGEFRVQMRLVGRYMTAWTTGVMMREDNQHFRH